MNSILIQLLRDLKGITRFLSRDEFAPFKQNSAEILEVGLHSVDQLF